MVSNLLGQKTSRGEAVTDKWKALIGFAVLLVVTLTLAYLAKLIALGNVEEKSSFGLAVLLIGLVEISKEYIKAFAAWVFHA
jgi:hypothetical protein